MLSIYIAGFDVFHSQAKQKGDEMKSICSKYGFQGLFPLDSEIKETTPIQTAREIFFGNIELIKKANIIVANLNEFRGAEPDSGTVFELGCGFALNKYLYGYIQQDVPLRKRVSQNFSPAYPMLDGFYDKNGFIIENFDLPLNLMLSVPVKLVKGDFEICVNKVSQDLATLMNELEL